MKKDEMYMVRKNHAVSPVISTLLVVMIVSSVTASIIVWGIPYIDAIREKSEESSVDTYVNEFGGVVNQLVREEEGSTAVTKVALSGSSSVVANTMSSRTVVSYSLDPSYNYSVLGLDDLENPSNTAIIHGYQGTVTRAETSILNDSRLPCFLAGTKILMDDYTYKNIDDIKKGEKVLSYDSSTQTYGFSIVSSLICHPCDEMGDYYIIFNDKLCVTPNHLLFLKDKWITVDSIKIGDSLFSFDGQDVVIYSIEKEYDKYPTFDLSLESYDTYFAEGVLVHSDSYQSSTESLEKEDNNFYYAGIFSFVGMLLDFFSSWQNNAEVNQVGVLPKLLPAVGEDIIDVQQTEYTAWYSFYGVNWRAQSFKPTKDKLSKVDLFIRRTVTAPSSDVVLSIRSSISGADLTSISRPPSDVSTFGGWLEFNFSDIDVTPGSTYYIVVRTSGVSASYYYSWGYYGASSKYSNGLLYISSNSGGSWTPSATGLDFCFKTYTVAKPVLSYSPNSWNFGNFAHNDTDYYIFNISNSGSGTLTYSLSESCPWVSVSPLSGSSTGEKDPISVTIDTTTLTIGSSYSCDISISSNDYYGASGKFTVYVTVVTSNPVLAYTTPPSHDFGVIPIGQTSSTSFEIWNSDTGTITYGLSEACSWVTVSPLSGSSMGEHDPISVTIDTTGLSAGLRSCDIIITSNNGSGIFTITATIQLVPVLSYSPHSYDFGYIARYQNVSTSFEIWNSGSDTLTYSLSESCPWVTVSPLSGSSNRERNTITVHINTTTLTNGSSYSCDITIIPNIGSTKKFNVKVRVASNLITVTRPSGDEKWFTGAKEYINWSFGYGAINISLFKGDSFVMKLQTNNATPNGIGSFLWAIPYNLTGNDYWISMEKYLDDTYFGESDYFTIQSPSGLYYNQTTTLVFQDGNASIVLNDPYKFSGSIIIELWYDQLGVQSHTPKVKIMIYDSDSLTFAVQTSSENSNLIYENGGTIYTDNYVTYLKTTPNNYVTSSAFGLKIVEVVLSSSSLSGISGASDINYKINSRLWLNDLSSNTKVYRIRLQHFGEYASIWREYFNSSFVNKFIFLHNENDTLFYKQSEYLPSQNLDGIGFMLMVSIVRITIKL